MMDPYKMTPEQQEAMIRMAAALVKAGEEIAKVFLEAIKPIADFYANLPEDIKKEIASREIDKLMKKGK
jgi:hypothetical protein